MKELERTNNGPGIHPVATNKPLTSLEIYDRYSAMAYGIILQIVPQHHLAQEILVNVFASPQLQACNSYPFSFAACVIKLARTKAVEAKKKLMELDTDTESMSVENSDKSPQRIFDLAFRQGFTPDEVAQKLFISKSEVLKAFHDFFKSYRNS
jgi:AraC-like DNA-binding protein